MLLFHSYVLLKRPFLCIFCPAVILEAYGKIPIMFLDVELEVSLRIAGELGIYAYDAYILRCAQKYLSPLVSLDRYLVDCAKSMGIRVMEVC